MTEPENILENWIQSLLGKSVEALNSKYVSSDVVTKELHSLQLSEGFAHLSRVSNALLEQLHQKLRDESCEVAIWNVVLWHLAHALPVVLAHDLIDRNVSVLEIAHARQVDEVQWRLATFDEDALYTLVIERYEKPEYSLAQFQVILKQYFYTVNYEGILYALSFGVASTDEKQDILVTAIKRELKKKRVGKFYKKRLKKYLKEQLA